MKIRLVGAELFHADGLKDMKLIVAFRSFANAPKNVVTEHKLKIKMEYGKIHIEMRMTECFKITTKSEDVLIPNSTSDITCILRKQMFHTSQQLNVH
jgi:hypothetical protein